MAKGRGKGKGSQFERDLCTRLSQWWTKDERDDVFWRSTISGGRATARSAKGKKTYGQYGDIQAVDPIGEPLLKAVTIEAKCGYRSVAFSDLLDAGYRMKPIWWKWLDQIKVAREQADSASWLLIVKRDRRDVIVVMPYSLYVELEKVVGPLPSVRPSMSLLCPKGHGVSRLLAMPLEGFLRAVQPLAFQKIAVDYAG